MGMAERKKLDVIEMKCLRSMCDVKRTNRRKSEGVRRTVAVKEEK